MITLYTKQGLTFTFVHNDITKVKADALVTGEGPDLRRESCVTQSLQRVAPQFRDVRRRLREKHGHLELWTVQTSEFGIPLTRVIHAVLTTGRDDTWLGNMKTLYKNIFQTADRLKISVLAIPLLGAGTADTERALSIKAVVTSVLTYSPKYLTEVKLVSNDIKVHDMMATQIKYEQSKISEPTDGLPSAICSGTKSLLPPIHDVRSDHYHSGKGNHTKQTERNGHHRHNPHRQKEGQNRHSAASSSQPAMKNAGTSDHTSRGGQRGHARFEEHHQKQMTLKDGGRYSLNHPSSRYNKEDKDLKTPLQRSMEDASSSSERSLSDQNSREVIEGIKESEKNVDMNCPICLGVITRPKRLDKCGHIFCVGCIDRSFKNFKSVCPSCNMVYGVLTGNQPDGTMDVVFSSQSLPGYSECGTITITYNIPSGTQQKGHPNPGKPYKGTTRQAYLPNNKEGKGILTLLRTAFDRKLTFTIGRSTTTGRDGVVTWNDIHHKTNMDGGPTRFGYPDPSYLSRVRDELANKGVTDSS